jgi:hypothetical protein
MVPRPAKVVEKALVETQNWSLFPVALHVVGAGRQKTRFIA